jgi:hypothetical protein
MHRGRATSNTTMDARISRDHENAGAVNAPVGCVDMEETRVKVVAVSAEW